MEDRNNMSAKIICPCYIRLQSIKHALQFYTTSSVFLVLCCLTSPIATIEANPIFDESSSDKEILDHLLKDSRYDKRLLPPVNGTLTVNVNVLLLSLASPDESSLKYEVEFLLNQQWLDPRLEYGNRSQYDFLNAIHHHEDIWLPDTYFIMHGDFKDPIIPMHFSLRIFRNGTIYYAMRRHLILSCQGSLNIFPFDDPLCSFAMESISYELSAVRYVWKNDEDTLRKSPSLTTLNAYLIKNATITCPIKNSWRGNYSCLKVDLTFTRDRAFYFTTVFIPGIILVTSSFITFWLEWNAVPARVMIGVTTMLNFFTTSNGFRSTLPVVSNLTAMNVWDGVCMCFIYASLLEFVCVNYVGRKRPLHNVVYRPGENPVIQRLPAVLSRIGILLASPLNVVEREFVAAISSESTSAYPVTVRQQTQTSTTSTTTPIQQRSKQKRSRQSSPPPPPSQQSLPPLSKPSPPLQQASSSPAVKISSAIIRKPKKEDEEKEKDIIDASTSITVVKDDSTRSELELLENDDKQKLSNESDDKKLSISDTTTTTMTTTTTTTTTTTSVTFCDDTLSTKEYPVRPPRRKTAGRNVVIDVEQQTQKPETAWHENVSGEKRRDTPGPNEIVACTCGNGSSPCTHSANNGCATDTCFVQIRKKEPPHPIRVAKTIDVIARVTFPTAYAVFLIFFFIHYK